MTITPPAVDGLGLFNVPGYPVEIVFLDDGPSGELPGDYPLKQAVSGVPAGEVSGPETA